MDTVDGEEQFTEIFEGIFRFLDLQVLTVGVQAHNFRELVSKVEKIFYLRILLQSVRVEMLQISLRPPDSLLEHVRIKNFEILF